MLSSYSHGYGQTSYHIVLVPKYRRRAFARPDIERCLRVLIEGIARKEEMRLHALEVMADHVHLFLDMPPYKSVAQGVQLLKGKTAYHLFRVFPELRAMFRGGHLWSRGKFFRSVGEVTADAIQHYILESQGTGRRPLDRKHATPPSVPTVQGVQSTLDAFAS
jgi:putative transposase